MSETTTTTIRQRVANAIGDYTMDSVIKSHEELYEVLCVYTDGTMSWVTHSNSSDVELCDGSPLPYLIKVGSGSLKCNCDNCLSGMTKDNIDEYDDEMNSEAYYDEEMCKALENIPVGYFDDEP